MSDRMKVMTVVGTRPEIIRLSRVIPALDCYMDHILVHTGQNFDYELNEVFFHDLELRAPDYDLDAAGATAVETIGQVIVRIDPILEKEKPEAFLVLGDTNSCLAAIPVKRRHIPIFHMEAGNRCFDERVPEETNRRIVDHIADINLPYSNIAREYLLREGLPPDRIIKTGSPMYEVLHHYLPRIQASDVLQRLALNDQDYYLVSCHREENVDVPAMLAKLEQVLYCLAETGKRVIVSTHPRTRNALERQGIGLPSNVELMKPLGFLDYVKLELHAVVTLSDSGTISEESNILNFPALNIREVHERPEAMQEGAVMMVGMEVERVVQGLQILSHQTRGEERLLQPVDDYQSPCVAEKVVRIIMSYTPYVQQRVWLVPR